MNVSLLQGMRENLFREWLFTGTIRTIKTRTARWYHVGIYVGTYYDRLTDQWYTDAVIEAASAGEHQGVIAKSLSDIEAHLPSNTSLYYSYLADVDY